MTTPEPTATADNPKLSAEEIGKRFLKLIGGLKSRNELSVERVQEATGLSLEHVPPSSDGTEYYAYSQPLEGGWEYLLRYFLPSKSIQEGIGLAFINNEDRYADMTAICLPHEDYHSALKAMGFRDAPIYGEIGQLISWRYYRDDITLSVISRPEIRKLDGKTYRACVESIGTLNGR